MSPGDAWELADDKKMMVPPPTARARDMVEATILSEKATPKRAANQWAVISMDCKFVIKSLYCQYQHAIGYFSPKPLAA